ncbi:ectonucleotide pyrophosphatase/phosphodiesterase family member 7-like isoform X3 [Pan troglodytes]|uniref:ectonucleotide pyrophosphatase/phosphodiesterase family member 7-like isoform X3 n=1 Tax=Pan troglodytes TaxID=9598 RepID=UPI003013BFD3
MARCPPAAAATTCPAGRPPPPREEEHSQLLPISFQGFRWDYDQDVDTPNRDRLAGEGVKAKYLMPPLVTMTSPSHFTAMPEFRPVLGMIQGTAHLLREVRDPKRRDWLKPWQKNVDCEDFIDIY